MQPKEFFFELEIQYNLCLFQIYETHYQFVQIIENQSPFIKMLIFITYCYQLKAINKKSEPL
jgi:hypothetical protein